MLGTQSVAGETILACSANFKRLETPQLTGRNSQWLICSVGEEAALLGGNEGNEISVIERVPRRTSALLHGGAARRRSRRATCDGLLRAYASRLRRKPIPISPTRPLPSRSMLEGSGAVAIVSVRLSAPESDHESTSFSVTSSSAGGV